MIKLWRFLSVPIVLAVCLGLLLVPALPQVALAQANAGIEVVPSSTTVGFATNFDLQIWGMVPNGTWDTGDAHLNFSPTYMQVNFITPGAALPLVLGSTWNNVTGTIDYTGGILGFVTGNQLICTINCTSKGAAGTSAIDFVNISALRITDIIDGGQTRLNWALVVNGTLIVTGVPILKVCVDPVGTGSVEANGTPLVMTAGCNNTTWNWSANVTLEAFPVAGWQFNQWTGDISGPAGANLSYVIMNGDKNVTANFTPLSPQISPNPTSLTFNAIVGAPNPLNKTLNICNSGGGILNWTANITNGNVTWLSMSPMSGGNLIINGTCNSTQVSVNITNMTAGTYTANITITGSSSVEVPVILNLRPPGVPSIQATPIPLIFTAVEGEDPPDQTLTICNSGGGTLNWSLSDDDCHWLSETPTSGSCDAGECDYVGISVDINGMDRGDYTCTITINGSQKKVPVTLRIVTALPEILVGPAQVSASALDITPQQVQPGREVTISINVANTGGETGSYNAVLYINGVVEDSQSVSVAGGTSKNVIFTVTKTKAGVYDVSVAGQSGQFEVVGGGWFGGGGLGTGGIIAIVVIVIILIGAVVFILRGTTKPE